MTSDTVSKTRLLRAVALVAALLVSISIVDAFADAGVLPAGARESQVGLDANQLIGPPGDIEGFVFRMEQAAATGDADPPDSFKREIGLPRKCRDVRVAEGGAIVGFVVDGDSRSAISEVESRMSGRGWRAVSLGGLEGSTFVKEEGSCIWALVTCTEIGSSTSVVFRCVYR